MVLWWWEVEQVAALRVGDGDDIEVLLRALLHLVDVYYDPRTLAVACFDLAEFIQYHSYGRAILNSLNAKKLVMNLLNHENAENSVRTLCSSRVTLAKQNPVRTLCPRGVTLAEQNSARAESCRNTLPEQSDLGLTEFCPSRILQQGRGFDGGDAYSGNRLLFFFLGNHGGMKMRGFDAMVKEATGCGLPGEHETENTEARPNKPTIEEWKAITYQK
ncbi:hypothetical protein RJ639_003693 [Escallonia herrerae]|uniref:ATPase V1 complex subunit H C-terminal domain-containing protein n=1 Tax=Escallonia herrerae TaxID=1293975 RepID=A0AA89AW99_9ASTE|nr:hypothetical protein RJ639_003693 [Escallonia herrerae]